MKLFSALYDRVMRWSRHAHAERYLAGLSFAESSFFPVPPDVLLAPMALARPDRAWRFAAVTTIASVAGGLLGYAIGRLALEAIEPLLVRFDYWDAYLQSVQWFEEWGFLAVFVAGFSPIPYKIFTIAAGAFGMFIPGFVLASTVGRGARFFVVAGLLKWGGERMEHQLKRHVDTLGWITVGVSVVVGAVLMLR